MKKRKPNGVSLIVVGVFLTLLSLILICDGIHVLITCNKEKATIVNVNRNVIEATLKRDNNSSYILTKKSFQREGSTINLYFSKTEDKKPVSRPISYVYILSLIAGLIGIRKGIIIYKGKRRRRK